MGFSQQEYLSGLPFPSPGDLPDPGIEPDSLPTELQGKLVVLYGTINLAGDEGGERGDSELRQ